MNNNQLQLVTFEQAQHLRKLGFDYKVEREYKMSADNSIACYRCGESTDVNNWWFRGGSISAPTIALALKWFRDEWHILYGIDVASTKKYIAQLRDENTFIFWSKEDCTSYEAAESALLDKLLTLPDCTAFLADIEKQPETSNLKLET